MFLIHRVSLPKHVSLKFQLSLCSCLMRTGITDVKQHIRLEVFELLHIYFLQVWKCSHFSLMLFFFLHSFWFQLHVCKGGLSIVCDAEAFSMFLLLLSWDISVAMVPTSAGFPSVVFHLLLDLPSEHIPYCIKTTTFTVSHLLLKHPMNYRAHARDPASLKQFVTGQTFSHKKYFKLVTFSKVTEIHNGKINSVS